MEKSDKTDASGRRGSSQMTSDAFAQDRNDWRRGRRARRTAVVRFRRRALEAGDFDAVMNDAMELAVRILDVELAKVLEYDAPHDKLIVRAAKGWPTDVAGRAIERAQESSQAGYALRTGHAVVVEDLRRVDAFRSTPILRDNDVISGATVIVHGQLAPWGVLSVHSTKRRMVTPDELDFLQAVADVVAAAAYRFLLARRREGLGSGEPGSVLRATRNAGDARGHQHDPPKPETRPA